MKLTKFCILKRLRTFSLFRRNLKEIRRYPATSANSNIANWFMEGFDLFLRSKLSARAHCPLVISNVTTKKYNLTVLYRSSISKCYMEIEQIVFLSNACYVFSKNKGISPKHNGRFRFQASTFTSVRRQTLPRFNFGETRYEVFQILVCTSVQYLIYCMTYIATRWILRIWKCFNSDLFWFYSTKDIMASTCTCFVYHHLTA